MKNSDYEPMLVELTGITEAGRLLGHIIEESPPPPQFLSKKEPCQYLSEDYVMGGEPIH